MGVRILQETTLYPITLIGELSGVCYGSDTSSAEKNFKRGLENIKSGHGRTLELPQVYMVIDEYSARVMRELYTHIAGAPTRLQASTRYINYEDLKVYAPDSIKKDEKLIELYVSTIEEIQDCYKKLLEAGIPKEDAANILPLGMSSKMVFRTNLRQLIDMSHQRLCTRAYVEFRELMQEMMEKLSAYSEEWKWLVDTYFKPKCEVYGYCTEAHGCGRKEYKEV